MRRSKIRFVLTAQVFVLLTVSMAVAQNPETPSMAPLNPAFVEHMSALQRGVVASLATADGHGLGYIPSPLDLSHLRNQPSPLRLAVGAPPSSYDLRTSGKITSVKNQGACGTCWAFATFGSFESALAPGEIRDFSENNLKNLSGFDGTPCDPGGGNFDMSTAYLARWAGPVNESDDPYQQSNANTSPPELPSQKHLQDTIIIPARADALDNDTLKSAVMAYGGLYTTMFWEGGAYNSATASYYTTSSSGTNHAVTLAGWDDNYSKSNFVVVPPGDGAFLIKNSWGTGWGQSGYFWLSYYDSRFAMEASLALVGSEPVTNYGSVYDYDPLGWVSGLGYGSTGAWFANVFTAVGSEVLKAVSTYVASNNSPYTIKIYTGVTDLPTSGTLAATTSGTFSLAGYHTVVLPSPVQLTGGQKFSVVMSLNTPGYNYPIPFEYVIAGYSSAAVAGAGQSYISYAGVTWQDFVTWNSTANVALKAFTVTSSLKKRRGQTTTY